MQLVPLSNTLRPVTLAAGLLSAANAAAYSNLDAYSGIITTATNTTTAEYLKTVNDTDKSFLLQKFRFQNYLINWERKVQFLSSPNAIITDEDFQSIVAMGTTAIPYIIEEIECKPSYLVWALNFICKRKITDNPNATISDACKLWVKELKR